MSSGHRHTLKTNLGQWIEERKSTGCLILFYFFFVESTPTLMMALFGMRLACLAGTVLTIFKKSPDKPDGYAVLATVD